MGTPGEFHQRWKPRGVCDTIDGDNVAPGAMSALTNLITDFSTPNCYVCRPANMVEIDFSTFTAPAGTLDVTTVMYQVSNMVYGLIGVTSGAFAGYDYPFAYNTITALFLPLAGVTTAKCPMSQATSGEWVPPQMSLTGVDLITTHIGFPGGTGAFFGWFDITDILNPTWNAGNTATNALPSVPQACQQFNNRTYLFCGNIAFYTDTLTVAMTNANQSFTIGDLTAVTCAAPLPVGTTSQGIVQGILAYKGVQVYLITGDVVLSDLALNLLSPSVGTAAPRSVVSTPEGVRFMTNDGIRNISFFGLLSEPDPDLAIPFIYAVTPSRVCAAFNADIYRICVQNGAAVSAPFQDYWYNFQRRSWTGPHSFSYDIAVPISNDFLLGCNTLPAKVWVSFSVQGHAGTGNSFTENGTPLTFNYTSAPMTDLENLYANCANRTTLEMAVPASGQTYNFTAQNENGTVLATASITEPSSQAIWGSFNWGTANWGASTSGLLPITIPWNMAVVFNKLSVMATGFSALGFKIGSLHNGYKRLNYLLN